MITMLHDLTVRRCLLTHHALCPTYQSRFTKGANNKQRSRSQSFHKNNNEVEMSEFAPPPPPRSLVGGSSDSMAERPSDVFDDGSARR